MRCMITGNRFGVDVLWAMLGQQRLMSLGWIRMYGLHLMTSGLDSLRERSRHIVKPIHSTVSVSSIAVPFYRLKAMQVSRSPPATTPSLPTQVQVTQPTKLPSKHAVPRSHTSPTKPQSKPAVPESHTSVSKSALSPPTLPQLTVLFRTPSA